MFEGILTAVGMMAAAACIIYLSYWFTKRIGAGFSGAAAGRNMKIVESLQVGTNRNVAIIKAGNGYYLVGITQTQITCLAKLDEDEICPAESGQGGNGSPFSKLLEQYVRRRPKGEEDEGYEDEVREDEKGVGR